MIKSRLMSFMSAKVSSVKQVLSKYNDIAVFTLHWIGGTKICHIFRTFYRNFLRPFVMSDCLVTVLLHCLKVGHNYGARSEFWLLDWASPTNLPFNQIESEKFRHARSWLDCCKLNRVQYHSSWTLKDLKYPSHHSHENTLAHYLI